jgi:hypothetical protein
VSPAPADAGEGELMKGACENTFHRFATRGDSLSIAHVILCGGVALTGPGTLHRLQFRARNRPGTTAVRLRRVQFYASGMFVNPAMTRDAVVIVSSKASPRGQVMGLCSPRTRPVTIPHIDVAEHASAPWRWQG